MGDNVEKNEIIERLRLLLDEIKSLESASKSLRDAERQYSDAKSRCGYYPRVSKFDVEHKENFITEHIGSEPVMPEGAIKLVIPVYRAQKARYDSAMTTYEHMYLVTERLYEERYMEERKALMEQDVAETNNILQLASERIDEEQKDYEQKKRALDANDIISESLKKSEIVSGFIKFFEEGRVDTLKEAVNLWYDEKRKDEEEKKAEAHRREILELEWERVRVAQAAEQAAQEAAKAAQDAADWQFLQFANHE